MNTPSIPTKLLILLAILVFLYLPDTWSAILNSNPYLVWTLAVPLGLILVVLGWILVI